MGTSFLFFLMVTVFCMTVKLPFAEAKSSGAQVCGDKRCTAGMKTDKNGQCYCCSNCGTFLRETPTADPCPRFPENCGKCLPGNIPVPNTERCREGFDDPDDSDGEDANVTKVVQTGAVHQTDDGDKKSGSTGTSVGWYIGSVFLVAIPLAVGGFLYRCHRNTKGRSAVQVDEESPSSGSTNDDEEAAVRNPAAEPLLKTIAQTGRSPSEASVAGDCVAESDTQTGRITRYSGDSLDRVAKWTEEQLRRAVPVNPRDINPCSTYQTITMSNAQENQPSAPPQPDNYESNQMASTPQDSGLPSSEGTTYSAASTVPLESAMPPQPLSTQTSVEELPARVETPTPSSSSSSTNEESSTGMPSPPPPHDSVPSPQSPQDEQLKFQFYAEVELTRKQRSTANDNS